MSDCRNPDARWPTAEIMRRARHDDDTGLIPFVDTDAAARYLEHFAVIRTHIRSFG